MKKRRELDALVANGKAGTQGPRFESPGTGSYCSSDAEDGTGPEGGLLFAEARGRTSRGRRGRGPLAGALRAGCTAFFVMGSLLAAAALTWLLADVRAQVAALRAHLDRGAAPRHALHLCIKHKPSHFPLNLSISYLIRCKE